MVGWIGIGMEDRARFDPRGLGASDLAPAFAPDAILASGSLILEAQFTAPEDGVQKLARLHHEEGWVRRLSLTISGRGVVTVEMQQGMAHRQVQLTMPVPAREARLRVCVSWDAPRLHGVVSVEDLDQETLHQVEIRAPLPLPIQDLARLIRRGRGACIGDGTRWIAVSDRVEPVGLPSGVGVGTPIETPDGMRAVDRLRPGDLVMTPDGPRPIRWITRREVPALGALRPVHLRAPYHGLVCDILVAPDHRLVVAGAEAEYLFGEDAVLVEARHLIDGRTAHRAHGGGTMTYYHLLLDEHACLSFAGLQGESLFVGGMGRDPALIATTALAEMPADAIPRHRSFARLPLSSYEARTLAASLVA